MDNINMDILIHLAEYGYLNVTGGQLICMLTSSELSLYQSLHTQKLVKIKKTCVGKTYQISKKGWKALPKNVKHHIIKEYYIWVDKIDPLIDEPRWIKWIK